MNHAEVSFDEWLNETFGRAVSGEFYPAFVWRDVEDWPKPVPDRMALDYLTRLFEQPEEHLRYFSDRQIAAGLWELGPGDSHCFYNRDIPVADRERLVGSVEIFFRDFFDKRCIPKLANAETDYTEPLNGACYMWWENITWGGAKDDPDADRLNAKDLSVMEAVLRLPNPACKEAALHGLGHLVRYREGAGEIIDRFLSDAKDADPELLRYARAARTGCIQ